MLGRKKSSKKRKDNGGDESSTSGSMWSMQSSTNASATETDTDATSIFTEDENENVERRDSLEQLDERSELEKELFDLVADGDKQAIKNFIAANTGEIDVTHRDIDGNDILTYAVQTGKKKILKLILEINPVHVDIYNALITAIKDNKMGIMLALLNFEDVRQGGAFFSTTKKLLAAASEKKTKKGESASTAAMVLDLDQKKYGSDVTPLMAAAIEGHYEIMQVLYDRGERLPKLHLPSCSDKECEGETRSLESILRRIELLKAMASPAYLIFMASQDGSFDPVYESFQLSAILDQCAEEEPGFMEEYTNIKEEVEELPCALVDLCRTTEEVKVLLAQTEGYTGPADNPFPRLGLAIDMKQRNFVTQPAVEHLIHNSWIGNPWNPKATSEKIIKKVVILALMVLFPAFNLILWLAMICCSQLPMVQFLLSPKNRSLSKLASHISFVILLLYMNMEERAEAEIEPPTIYIRWIVMIYVTSHLFALLRRFMHYREGFWKRGWNKLEVVTQLLFWATFGIWIYLLIRKEEMGFEHVVPRRKLDKLDPLIIGDCFFALASTFGSLRIMRWFVLSSTVGPIQTGIAKMWRTGIVVVAFLVWATVAFVVSTRLLYRPYLSLNVTDEEGNTKEQSGDMTSFDQMFLTFIGLNEIPPDGIELITPNKTFVNAEGELDHLENPPEVTQAFVTGICVFFTIIIMGFLQPAVVGLFGGGEEDTLDKDSAEWHYLLIQEWLYNINDTYLTPPFNLLPTVSSIQDAIAMFKKPSSGSASGNKGRQRNKDVESPDESSEQEDAKRKYPFLMRKLFTRFFQQQNLKEGEEGRPEKQDVQEVQQALKELKEMSMKLLDVPRKSSSGGSTGAG